MGGELRNYIGEFKRGKEMEIGNLEEKRKLSK